MREEEERKNERFQKKKLKKFCVNFFAEIKREKGERENRQKMSSSFRDVTTVMKDLNICLFPSPLKLF